MNDRGRETGRVFANVAAIKGRLLELGWSQNRLAAEAEVDASIVSRMMRGRGVSRDSAAGIAAALDGNIPDYFDGRRPADGRRFELPPTEEWAVDEYRSDWQVASNGLRFLVCDMTHRHTPTRRGRGKFYSLLGVRGEERATRDAMLKRHAVASATVGLHPNVAENLSTVPTPDGNGWWVVDRWVDGETLAERFARGAGAGDDFRSVAVDMLQGLAALHAAGVVFRELAPSRVIVPPGGPAVLTDFELAKLFDGSPSVSRDWPDDPYRAPEVEGGDFDRRADLYSWARVVTHAALGHLPRPGEDAKRVRGSSLPNGVRAAVSACLAVVAGERPRSADSILGPVADWE